MLIKVRYKYVIKSYPDEEEIIKIIYQKWVWKTDYEGVLYV